MGRGGEGGGLSCRRLADFKIRSGKITLLSLVTNYNVVYDEQLHNTDQDMKYYNSHSTSKRQKKHEKTTPTAKSKATLAEKNRLGRYSAATRHCSFVCVN